MLREIEAKTLLSGVKSNGYNVFGLKYNMNLYRGCQHACIYCDSRSNCYKLGPLDDIRAKWNAMELLEKELRSKKVRGTIGFGSMNDPYMPLEKERKLTRSALKLVTKYKFPVHIITKSNLVCRDIDLLQQLNKTYAAISFTITTANDELAAQIEPFAPLPSERFEAIKTLTEAGIYCGICFMPVLPFITDSAENIENVLQLARNNGAQYALGFLGMTLRDGQREYYYNKLDLHFKGLKDKYIQTYGNNYEAKVPDFRKLESHFYKTCKNLGLTTTMKFYKPTEFKQLKLF